MCAVSMIFDHYREKWTQPPYTQPTVPLPQWPDLPSITIVPNEPRISAAELAEFRSLLERAREYDKRMNQPDCELDEKRQALKKIADELGVEISFL